MNKEINMSSISLMISGIEGFTMCTFQLAKSCFLSSMQSIPLGLNESNFGERLHEHDLRNYGEGMKYTLAAVTGTIGALGALQISRKIKQRNLSEITKGTVSTLTGIALAALSYSLDSRMIMIAHQASILRLTSALLDL